MTTAEYTAEKKAIIEQYGKPVWKPELNESAKLLSSLKSRRYYENKKKTSDQKTKERLDQMDAKLNRPAEMPCIPVGDDDLQMFDPTEKKIIKVHFDNTLLTAGEIAEKLGEGLTSQLVASVLNSKAVKDLEHKLMVENLSLGVWEALRHGIAKKDTQFIKMALDLGIGLENTQGLKGGTTLPEVEFSPREQEVLRVMGDLLVNLKANLEPYNLLIKDSKAGQGAETIEVQI